MNELVPPLRNSRAASSYYYLGSRLKKSRNWLTIYIGHTQILK